MIVTKNLSKTFFLKQSEIKAVHPNSLHIKEGEIFGLLGPNGAGKTTLLRMLSTILSPTSGEATINGFDLSSQTEEVKKSIGFLSGNTKLYGRLTPKEILYYFGELHDMKKKHIKNRFEEVVGFLGMKEFTNQSIEKLSTGQTQRTSIARCIFHDPKIYILDEPTLGLDILSSRTIMDFIKSEKEKGKTIIFSTHIVQEFEMLVDRIALIHNGKILECDTLDNIREKTNLNSLSDIFFKAINKNQEEKI